MFFELLLLLLKVALVTSLKCLLIFHSVKYIHKVFKWMEKRNEMSLKMPYELMQK